MISVFEEQQILIPPSILEEIYQNSVYFVQLQRIKFVTLHFYGYTVTGNACAEMLSLWLLHWLEEDLNDLINQQDEALL